MKVLTVGFGGMGCRHTQSLLNEPGFQFYILETNKEVLEANIPRIGASMDDFQIIESLDAVPGDIDFAIIATSAYPRFDITKALINKGIKRLLLEKVVFQSDQQFEEISQLLEANGAVAYCNFVNRYFPNYIEIKQGISTEEKITMTAMGNDFGVGCNALHYLDLFEYLTGSKATLVNDHLEKSNLGNRRGAEYREVTGSMTFTNTRGDNLLISGDAKYSGGVVVTINDSKHSHILNEESLKHFTIPKDGSSSSEKPFQIIYTSQLTAVLLKDMMSGEIRLPSVQSTRNAHQQIFKAINPVLETENDLCPIT